MPPSLVLEPVPVVPVPVVFVSIEEFRLMLINYLEVEMSRFSCLFSLERNGGR